jgi:16S rRNA (uracil1498-N3)-methyltransferase
MALPFFYLPKLVNEDILHLDEANSRHVVAVLRMAEGEEIHITDGKGNLYTAAIISPHKKKCAVKLTGKQFEARNNVLVTIAISPVKNVSRMEWFLEKATEIGVAEIIPLICHRTEKMHFRFERMQQIIISAMLQSQQVWLPRLHEPELFNTVIDKKGFGRKWIAHCLPEERKSLREQGAAQNAQLLLIGPEGDFTPEEIQQALALQCEPVMLGDNRLRTETAGMVGATLLCVR